MLFLFKALVCGAMSPVRFQVFKFKIRFLCIRRSRVFFSLLCSAMLGGTKC